MFSGISNGFALVIQGLIVFIRRPKLLFPMLLCWCIYAPLAIYLEFHYSWKTHTNTQNLMVIYFAILLMAIIFSWCSFVLLELIRQLEKGLGMSMTKAFFSGVENVILAFPIVLIWSSIWFLITVIEIFTSRRRNNDGEETPENVARTLSGLDDISLSEAFFEALKKGLRMLAFLTYPAVAWEKMDNLKAMQRGLSILRSHGVEFATGVVITDLAAGIVLFPPAVLFILSSKAHIHFSDTVWFATIIYCAFAWSFSIFLEQIFTAELYLWHVLWEKECIKCKVNGKPLPELEDVKRPSILDNIDDMKFTKIQ